MGAPQSAFKTQTLNIYKNGILTNSIAIPDTDITNLKNRFYLDYLFQVQTPSGNGFIGGCVVNSFNYNHHNPARIGALRSYNSGIVNYFTDGGLNTLADSSNIAVPNARLGNVQVSQLVTSAYYDSTSTIGVQYKNPSAVWVNWMTAPDTVAAATSVTKTITGEQFDGYVAGDSVEVRGYVTNPEGTYTATSTAVFTLLMASFTMKYNATYASTANSGAVYKTIYADRVPLFDGGGRLFKTDTYPLTYSAGADAGYYIYNGYWYKIGELTAGGWVGVLDFGVAAAGQYPSGDPANPATYSEIVFNAYSTIGGANSCATGESNFTRYIKTSDGKVYTDTGFGTLLPNGYYTRGTGMARKWYQYSGGLVVAQDFCTAPE